MKQQVLFRVDHVATLAAAASKTTATNSCSVDDVVASPKLHLAVLQPTLKEEQNSPSFRYVGVQMSHEKNRLNYFPLNPGCLIVILLVAYDNPHLTL